VGHKARIVGGGVKRQGGGDGVNGKEVGGNRILKTLGY